MRAWLRRRLHADDPTLLPFKVRLFMMGHGFFAWLGVLIIQPGWPHGMAYLGLVSGTFAGSILFWESQLQQDDIERVTRTIMEAGQDRKLTRFDKQGLYVMMAFFLALALLAEVVIVERWQSTGNGYRAIVQSEIIWLFLVAMAGLLFALNIGIRIYFHNRANLLKSVDHAGKQALVKRYLQTLGFLFLIAAGILQMPSNLWWRDGTPKITKQPLADIVSM